MKHYFSMILSFLFFLVQPEDTSTEIQTEWGVPKIIKLHYAGIIKTVFWFTVAVIIGIAFSTL